MEQKTKKKTIEDKKYLKEKILEQDLGKICPWNLSFFSLNLPSESIWEIWQES